MALLNSLPKSTVCYRHPVDAKSRSEIENEATTEYRKFLLGNKLQQSVAVRPSIILVEFMQVTLTLREFKSLPVNRLKCIGETDCVEPLKKTRSNRAKLNSGGIFFLFAKLPILDTVC